MPNAQYYIHLVQGRAQHPAIFTPRFVSVVGAGEHTGRLAPALDQLAAIMAKEQDAKQKAKQTMMMPMFTMGASLLMLVMMLTVLLPPLLETFEKMGKDIPMITKIAIVAVGAITHNTHYILGGGILVVGGFWGLRRLPNAQYYIHLVQARMPILGPLIMAGELSQFSRTIAMLLESGIPLATALPLAIAGCKNLTVRRAFAAGEESLVAGHGLTEALRTFSILPKMWGELVMIGEESNTLTSAKDPMPSSVLVRLILPTDITGICWCRAKR